MKRVLITGANSYIGVAFEKYMKQFKDFEIDTIDMQTEGWKESSFCGYDSIFHVAGIAHIRETVENEDLYYKVNRDLAVEVAMKGKIEGVKQFVFLSSMSVYGLITGRIDFNTTPIPVSNYGKSKLMAEEKLKELSSSDYKVAIVRPPMVYGENCKGNYNQLRKFALSFPVFPKVKNQRSMIYIENLCEFIKQVIVREVEGLFFPQNIEYVCTADMVKGIAKNNGKDICLTKLLNPYIYILKKIPGEIGNTVNKAFGDLIYDMSMSEYSFEYRVADLEKSLIERS